MTRRKPCLAAKLILAELHADRMQRWYDRTHSHRAKEALRTARTAALEMARRRKATA